MLNVGDLVVYRYKSINAPHAVGVVFAIDRERQMADVMWWEDGHEWDVKDEIRHVEILKVKND